MLHLHDSPDPLSLCVGGASAWDYMWTPDVHTGLNYIYSRRRKNGDISVPFSSVKMECEICRLPFCHLHTAGVIQFYFYSVLAGRTNACTSPYLPCPCLYMYLLDLASWTLPSSWRRFRGADCSRNCPLSIARDFCVFMYQWRLLLEVHCSRCARDCSVELTTWEAQCPVLLEVAQALVKQ